MTRFIFFIQFIMLLFTAMVSYPSGSDEDLAKKFVNGVVKGLSYDEMDSIFMTEKDFDGYIEMLRDISGLSAEHRAMVNSSEEKEKARIKFLKTLKNFRDIWDKGVRKIKDDNLIMGYASHTLKSENRSGLMCSDIEIHYTLEKEGKKETKTARITAIHIKGRLKIADFLFMKM